MNLSIEPLDSHEQITIAMSSIPERRETMLKVAEQLLPYCDNLDICLDGYELGYYPDVFDDPKITVIRQIGGFGARGKFCLARRTKGYYLTVDDDIDYPSDYVGQLVSDIERFSREAIIGYHGGLVCRPEGRMLFTYQEDVLRDTPVHFLGTGLMGFHTDTFKVDVGRLIPGKVDDQVATLAQEQQVPMIVARHRTDWALEREEVSLVNALRRDYHKKREALDRVMQQNWELFQCQSVLYQ